MPFGFFKKKEPADTIFMGGKIFTQNTNLPWAEAVACKDGLVLAVGDYEDLSELEGKDTEIVDLEGGIMLPGYIDTCGHSVFHAFQDSCLFLKKGDLENILTQLSEYVSKNQDAAVIFAYGFDENYFKDIEQEQIRTSLDTICGERPAVVLGKSGLHCWINTIALETVKAAAEEEEVSVVSLSYLLNVLEPIDLDRIPDALPINMQEYCRKGFTSVFDCGAPEFFATLYQNIMVDLYQENRIQQRFFGSLLLACDVNPAPMIRRLAQYKTNCIELNEFINFNTLKLVVDRTAEAVSISGNVLKGLCLEAGDKGFDIHIDAIGKDAVIEAVEVLEATRAAGYKKNSFTIAHDHDLTSEELADTTFRQDIKETVGTLNSLDNDWLCIENAKSVEEAIEMLTIDAAIQLGISSRFGSIEKGKHADFVIFDKNPLEIQDLSDFKKLRSVMTVLDGSIVYDAREEK
jgi:predicted amidohydrolase YtcJ